MNDHFRGARCSRFCLAGSHIAATRAQCWSALRTIAGGAHHDHSVLAALFGDRRDSCVSAQGVVVPLRGAHVLGSHGAAIFYDHRIRDAR